MHRKPGLFVTVLLGLLAPLSAVAVSAAPLSAMAGPGAGRNLPRSSPESQGVSSALVGKFIQTADAQVKTLHSFMLVRHGHVVAECWWKPQTSDTPHVLHSLSKSFTATAVGLAIEEGRFTLDDPVLNFFPEAAAEEPVVIQPPLRTQEQFDAQTRDLLTAKNRKAMRVRDLLTMTAGHQVEMNWREAEGSWTKAFLDHSVPHKPGTHFQYNTPATYMLSAIVQKTTGQTVLEYLRPRLFEPLGIANPQWGSSSEGINFGGFGLMLRTEDIAKFGQLYLQQGMWEGRQLIPSHWVQQATSKQVANGSNPDSDWEQGYGFRFWRCRHNAFRGDGKDGQFCIVLPELDAVIAITAETGDMQAELNLVWDYLLPAIQTQPLPAAPNAEQSLKEICRQLTAGQARGASEVRRNETIDSQILGKPMKYSVYLPAGYAASQQKYPVLYLLHGRGDDELGWLNKGNLQPIADATFAARIAIPMIIVMPDAGMSYYVNNARGDLRYEDYFFQELLPQIEARYRCQTTKEGRTIAGLSMGGYGSLLYSLHHPELFSACYAMSAGVRTDEEFKTLGDKEFRDRYEIPYGPIDPGQERLTPHYQQHSILNLVENVSAENRPDVRFTIDCGDDDFLTGGNARLHLLMREKKIPHEYRVRDGGHQWPYWRQSLPEALRFVSETSH